MRLIVLVLLTAPAVAHDWGEARSLPGQRRVLRVNSRFLGRGLSSYHHQSRRDQSWRLHRVRRPAAHQDPYSYGRCYWRGYYRPYLYCRQYKPRYSYYSTAPRRYPQPAGFKGPSYPHAYARPSWYGAGYGGVYQSRYGYRYPHRHLCGGAGPYGFADPWGYRLLPAFDFAPILTRLTTVYTIDDPAFDGEAEEDNADGLPMPRTKPVGERFLQPVD